MSRTLVVYHSRSGYTRRVAQALAQRLGAELEEIERARPANGVIGYARCAWEALARSEPALRAGRIDPPTHDVVIVGTPVWFGRLAGPVRSWLVQHRLCDRTRLACYCTMGGSGATATLDEIAGISGKVPAATMALTDLRIDAGVDAELDAFVRRLRVDVSPLGDALSPLERSTARPA